MRTQIDEAFIGRVYKTSAYIWAFGLAVCLICGQYYAAIGWTIGAGVSVGIMRSLEWVVRRSFVPGNNGARAELAKVSIVKLLIIAAILSVIIIAGGRSFALVAGFCAGLILTQAVIVLKVLGMLVSGRFAKE